MTSGVGLALSLGGAALAGGVAGYFIGRNRRKENDQEFRYYNPPTQIVQIPVPAAQPQSSLQPVHITNNNTNNNSLMPVNPNLLASAPIPAPVYSQPIGYTQPQQPITYQPIASMPVYPQPIRSLTYQNQNPYMPQPSSQPIAWNNSIVNTNTSYYNPTNINFSQLPPRLPMQQPPMATYLPAPNYIADNRLNVLDNSVTTNARINAEKVYIINGMPSQMSSEQPEIAIIPWPSENVSTIQYI